MTTELISKKLKRTLKQCPRRRKAFEAFKKLSACLEAYQYSYELINKNENSVKALMFQTRDSSATNLKKASEKILKAPQRS
jgi:hypothetical protein